MGEVRKPGSAAATSTSTSRQGFGAPSNDLGGDGDYYTDLTTGNEYQRQDGVYSQVMGVLQVVATIVGPQGPQGIQGEVGPQGPKGDTGATGAQGETPTMVDGGYF